MTRTFSCDSEYENFNDNVCRKCEKYKAWYTPDHVKPICPIQESLAKAYLAGDEFWPDEVTFVDDKAVCSGFERKK